MSREVSAQGRAKPMQPLHLVRPAGRLDGLKLWRGEGDT
jgi:hypothetical protein